MTRHLIRSILPAFVVAALTGCSAPGLPASDPDNGGLILPGGFEALVVADSVGRGRHIAVNDNGDIYMKLTHNDAMKGKGGTVGLRDLNGDGKADSIVYFGDYTDVGGSAVGVTIHNGYLYTSTNLQVLRNKLKDGELVPTSRTEVIVDGQDLNEKGNWHTTKPVAFDNHGNMYVPFGGHTNAAQDITKFGPAGIPNGKGLDPAPDLINHGGIWRFDANKENQTQKDGYRYAMGLRSILGLTWSPLDDHLYTVMNGIDNFHTLYPSLYTSWQAAVLPAETLIKVTDGGNYGWPYAYYDQMLGKNMLEPGYGGDGKIVGRATEFDLPVYGFPGHWAPMDMMFYTGDQFPERYKNGVFIAFHGSSDRAPYPQAGYIVCFLPFENGKPVKDYEVFADGFAQVDTVKNTSDAVYRPMGLSQGPDGSLFISESNKGKIWRVMYKGDKNNFGDAQLAALKHRKETVSYIKTPDSVADKLNKGSELAGGILYNTYCSTCHARDGLGDNNRYPPLAGSEIVNGDKERLIGIVMNGLQGPVQVAGKTWDGLMPAHGAFLDDVAIASITSYIRHNRRFKNNSDAVSPDEVAKVREATAKKKVAAK